MNTEIVPMDKLARVYLKIRAAKSELTQQYEAELRRLIRLVQRTGIGELEVSTGGRTVRIAAPPAGVSGQSAQSMACWLMRSRSW